MQVKFRVDNWRFASKSVFGTGVAIAVSWRMDPPKLPRLRGMIMNLLYWALVALVVAIVAGALGFGGIAAGAASIAKILFGIFLVVFFVLLIMAIIGTRKLV
jgi:uncharacterized membrane protein YtjA (UPF0391 family)